MPLTRYISIRSKFSTDDALNALITASSVTRDISDMLQFTPAKAAASILLLIFQTIQNIQTNKQDCHRLARRCLSLLVDMRDQLADHVESAPPSLIKAMKKFEETLQDIYDFMKMASEQKWAKRLMRKTTIEGAIADYNAALDDAARAFQIATLINIHLAVGEATPSKSKTVSVSEPSTATIRDEGVEIAPPRSATLPPYVSGSSEAMTDVQALTTSPCPTRSATMSSYGTASRSDSTGRSERTTRSPGSSFDLIDLSSSVSDEFSPLLSASSRRDTSFGSIAEEPEEESDTQELPEEEEPSITEHHGFNRYHQSQFRMKGKSRTIKDGWWAGALEGEVNGQKSLMLRYDGDRKSAMKLVGYSNDETPTPFILLANVQTRLPQALLLDSLKKASLARDTLDAALYYQQQLNLSDSKLQDYVEHASYRIDMEQAVIMGLPPPEIDNIVSWRNFGLAHSIRDIYLRLLPNRGMMPKQPVDKRDDSTSVEMQRKINHLTVLARAILPSTDDISTVHERLHKLLGTIDGDLDEEEEPLELPPMSLRQIRQAAISINVHQASWFESSGIAPHKFSVGDIGYIPKDEDEKSDWSKFVLIGNVLTEGLAKLEVSSTTNGKQSGWRDRIHQSADLASFELPGGIHGWTAVVPPEAEYTIDIVHVREMVRVHDAWGYLLDAGKEMARKHGIQPEDLILITRAGTDQRFKIRDLRQVRYWPTQSGSMHSFHQPQFGGHNFHHGHGMGFGGYGHFGHQPFGGGYGGGDSRRLIQGQDLAPKVFYLFTSPEKDHEPYFSLTPVHAPRPEGEKPPELDPNQVRCFAQVEMKWGFLNYVQLHAEDFLD
ncbi:hypothetical protein GSI_11647 [Ganoderma sinense ZZ0214-1]|uniref:Mixed lineage kinase domain-containing protein n=1 Tax=Ganoderma sinense ZZ0214-1 TaxID=1077348 RepID=A0A2G8RWN2_9APHY|nr:hypothetical protein GSI_11647 [Ganoderma sinense ZZ0214-1]